MERTLQTAKKGLIAFLFVFTSYAAFGQTWTWAKSGTGSAQEFANGSCTDAAGNIFIGGTFYSNPLQMGTVTLNNSGSSDAYVAKYDPSGTVIWAQKIGGGGSESISGVATDAAGNVYVIGTYNTQFLNVAPYSVTNFTNNLSYDVFVACYNSNGIIQWLKSFGGALNEYSGGCVYSNALGSLYVGGSYYSSSCPVGTTTLTNSDPTGNKHDMWLARLTGTVVTWAKTAGAATSNDAVQQLAIDSNNDVYYSGYFYPNSATTTIGGTIVTTYGGQDMLVGKYNSSGTPVWVKNWGSTVNSTSDFSGGITIDANNGIFLGATTNGTAIIAGSFTTPTSGGYDAFAARTSSTGTFQWLTKVGAAGDQFCNSLTNNNNGSIFMTGSFSGTNVVVGSQTLTNSLPGTSTDVYVLKLTNTSGLAVWALTAQGPGGDESGSDITSDVAGNIYVSGTTYTAPTAFATTTITGVGLNDIFLAKINCLTPTITGVSSVCQGYSATLTATGATSYTWNTAANGSVIVVSPTASAVYSVIAQTGGCQINSSNFSLTMLPAIVNAGADFSLTCNTNALMNAQCTPSNPTSIQWSPSAGLSSGTILTPTVTAPSTPATYVLTATLTNGCVQTDTVVVYPLVPKPDICIVTVDSLNQNNEIFWDKLAYPMLDSMIVYRETSTNVYKRIGAVPSNSISLFSDTLRSIGPSNGDPKLSTYRYKIQVRDQCGNYGPLSLWHNTVFFTHTGATFFWVNNYQIEGPTNPVQNYSLIVCPNPTVSPTYTLVGVTTGNQFQLTDPNYNAYQTTADWRVVAYLGYYCYAQKTTQQGKSTQVTRSNISNNRAADISVRERSLVDGIVIFPNPADKFLQLNYGATSGEVDVKMINMLGQIVHSEKMNEDKKIDVSEMRKGVYTLILQTAQAKVVHKIIVD
jgi:hypothetical protein